MIITVQGVISYLCNKEVRHRHWFQGAASSEMDVDEELIGQSITFIGQLMVISSCHKISSKTINSSPKQDGAGQRVIYGSSEEMGVCVKLPLD